MSDWPGIEMDRTDPESRRRAEQERQDALAYFRELKARRDAVDDPMADETDWCGVRGLAETDVSVRICMRPKGHSGGHAGELQGGGRWMTL